MICIIFGLSNWSIQRVFWVPKSPTNAFIVYYGNAAYSTLLNAVNAINTEPFTEAPDTAANAVFIGYIIIEGGINRDLLNSAHASIIQGGLFRNIAGVGSGGTQPVATTLAGLSDVGISSPAIGDLLVYTGATWNNTKSLNGNSYGFKINLKFDTDVESTGVEQAINDYSSFSLSIFMDAATVLQDAAKNLNDRTLQIAAMQEEIAGLKDLIINTDDSTEIKNRLDVIESSLQANQALFDNTQDILNLIEQNTDTINNILQNQTSVNLSYNLDLLKDGSGTSVDRSVPNILKVNVTQQDYNIGTSSLFTINPVAGNTVPLSIYTNYLKHKNNGVSITANNDIVIRIDDTINKWEKGQVLRFIIGDDIDLGNYSLVILTDALGEYPKSNPSGVPYSSVVAGFLNIQFSSSNYKPIFDIVCIDAKNLIFEIDQIR